MDATFTVDIEDNLLIIRFQKKCSYKDIIRAIDVIADYPDNKLRFWDVTHGMDVTSTQMRQIAAHSRQRLTGRGKIAIVTAEDLAYGFSRIFQVFRQDERASVMVFRSEAEAFAWLKEDV